LRDCSAYIFRDRQSKKEEEEEEEEKKCTYSSSELWEPLATCPVTVLDPK
jgi:hypothetical protein